MVSTVSKAAPSTTVVKKEEPKKDPPKKEEPPKVTPPKTESKTTKTEVKTADLKSQPSGGLDPKTQFTVTKGLKDKVKIENAGTTTTGTKPGATTVKTAKDATAVKTTELPVTGAAGTAKKAAADAKTVAAAGQRSDGVIGKIQQVSAGTAADCWWLASVQGFSKDKKGKQVIQKAISTNADGSYTVRFAGNNNKAIKVSKADVSNQNLVTKSSDVDAKIITVAADKYFKNSNISSGMKGGGVAPDAMKLLNNSQAGVFTNRSGKAQVKSFLQGSADTLGKGKVVTVAGRYVDDRKVNFDTGNTNHTVTITKISGNTVTYTNTHDTTHPQTISLDKLAGQIANDRNNSYLTYTYV